MYKITISHTEIGIYRDNFSPLIVIAQKSFDLSITDIAFVIYLVIADKLSRETIFYAHSAQTSELMSWRYGKNTRCPLSLIAIFKKTLFVLFNATTESVNHSVFWKNLQNTFAIWFTKKKNFVKHIENLSEKFIGDNLSITDIALRNWDLSIIGIAQGFFEVIDYRYRCSTERFIVPITAHTVFCLFFSNYQFYTTVTTQIDTATK